MSNRYLDFELQIERTDTEGLYHVSVAASPAGETQQPLQISFPFDDRALERLQLKLENALLRSRTRVPAARYYPKRRWSDNLGRNCLKPFSRATCAVCFTKACLKADHEGKGVRLKLRIQPPEFAQLPWEFLLEPRRDEYICLSRETPVVRYLELAQPALPLTVAPPLRILGMVASPVTICPNWTWRWKSSG